MTLEGQNGYRIPYFSPSFGHCWDKMSLTHINELKDNSIQLSGVGVQITDREFVMVLLGSLLDSYMGFVQALESQQVELKLAFMQQHFLHEEAQQKEATGNYS